MAGAMDLAEGLNRIVVVIGHTNSADESKPLSSRSLPHKGKDVFNRIISNLSAHYTIESGLKIVECAGDVTEEDFKAGRKLRLFL